jgi:hypothetical protein
MQGKEATPCNRNKPMEHVIAWAARYFPTKEEALDFVEWYMGFIREYPDMLNRSYPELLRLKERA